MVEKLIMAPGSPASFFDLEFESTAVQADLAWAIEGKEAYVPAKRDGNDRNLGEDDEPGKAKGKAKGKGKSKVKP